MFNKQSLQEPITVKIKHLRNKEVIEFTLQPTDRDRYKELDKALKPFGLWFGDEDTLYEGPDQDFDMPPTAKLISDTDDLTYWLMNDPSLID
jgi:hypothetical protein